MSDPAERHVVVPVELLERAKYILANNAADGDELAAKIFTALTALSAAPPVQMEAVAMPDRAERHVVVPVEPTDEMVMAVEGQLTEARGWNAWSTQAVYRAMIAAAPPVQMEAVAWRVGVPNNEYATLREDVAEIARKHGYEITPLYASPVPSSERFVPCVTRNDEAGFTEMILEDTVTIWSVPLGTMRFVEFGHSVDKRLIALRIWDDTAERDDIIEMCAAKLDAESVKMKERCRDPDETVSRAILIGKAQHYSDAASSIRSLKSQPEAE